MERHPSARLCGGLGPSGFDRGGSNPPARTGSASANPPLDEIARRAGTGNKTLYRRFPTRGDLIAAVFAERTAEHLDAVQAGLTDPDPWSGFASYITTVGAMQAPELVPREMAGDRPPTCCAVTDEGHARPGLWLGGIVYRWSPSKAVINQADELNVTEPGSSWAWTVDRRVWPGLGRQIDAEARNADLTLSNAGRIGAVRGNAAGPGAAGSSRVATQSEAACSQAWQSPRSGEDARHV